MTKIFILICVIATSVLSFSSHSFAQAVAESSTEPAYNSVTTGTILQTLLALILVIVAIFASSWVIKRLNSRIGGTSLRSGKIISTCALGNRERLIVIDFQNQRLLLGVTTSNVNLIKDLTDQLGKDENTDNTNPPSSAGKLFKHLLKH